jgi:hypothetical protein
MVQRAVGREDNCTPEDRRLERVSKRREEMRERLRSDDDNAVAVVLAMEMEGVEVAIAR